jgi:lipoprotein-releasing system permease protein
MNLPIFIARKLVKGTPRKGRQASRTVIGIAIAAIAISMAVMIVAVAIVTGFQQSVRNKVIGFGSHIVVEPISQSNSHESSPIANVDSVANVLRLIEGVTVVQAYAHKAGMFKTGQEIENIVIKGLPKKYDAAFLQSVLVDGVLPVFSDSLSKQILISKYTARRLSIKTGDKLLVYFLVKNDIRKRKFTICGTFESGFEEFDKMFSYIDIRHIQQLNGWDSTTAAGLEVVLPTLPKLTKPMSW